MDFSFSDEQEAVRDLARRIFSDACGAERLAELERDEGGDGVDRTLLAALAEANLLGVALGEDQGGSDFGLTALLVLLEEAGRSLAPVPLLPSLVLGALGIDRFGSDAQRERWLPGVVAGTHILTAALDELGGSDASCPRRTTATAEGDTWRLDGEKVCVPLAAGAARVVVPAATGSGGVTIFLVDPTAAGVNLEMGLSHDYERQYRMSLDGVRLAADDVLGDPGAGAGIASWIVARAKVSVAALELGLAEEALRRTAEYTSARKQFGRAIGTFQAVTMRAADAFIDIECMRSTLWQAAWRLESDLPATREVAAARWWACRGTHRVVHTAQHLHGGTGADIDYPIHRFFLRAKQLELVCGGAGAQLAEIGASLASR